MTAKKKLITVEEYAESSPFKSYKRLIFSMVSHPKNGRKQCHAFIGCRDFLCDNLRSAALQTPCASQYNPGMDPDLDFTKTRLLLATDLRDPANEFKPFRDRLFSGKRVLNYYEKLAGWKASKITTVKHTTKENAWLLTGPPQWMAYSNLLSMAVLILRVASKYGPLEFSERDPESLEKMWADIVERNPNDYDCGKWIKDCYQWFPVLMRRYKDIFTQGLEGAYQADASRYHTAGGIHSLVTRTTNNSVLTKNINKIAREEKLE